MSLKINAQFMLPQALGKTASPTFNGLTLNAGGNGLRLNNTTDPTNYERLEALWSGNVGTVQTTWAGTGTPRNLALKAGAVASITLVPTASSSGFTRISHASSATAGVVGTVISGSYTAASGVSAAVGVYNTYNQSGTAGATDLLVSRSGTVGSGAQLFIDCQDGGASKLSVANSGAVTSASSFISGASSGHYWNGRSRMFSDADGQIRLSNAAGTDFARLQFGGTTGSFPSLKRNTSFLEVRLADDSGYTPLVASHMMISDGVTAPATVAGIARLYVDSADGDLKIKFGDGTIKTIVVDT